VPGVLHAFTGSAAWQVQVAHEHLLRIAIAVWPTRIIATPGIVGFLIMSTGSTPQRRPTALVIAMPVVVIAHVLRMVVDDAVVTVIYRRRRHRLTPLLCLVPGAVVA
jgi:hypothetical protein